MGSMDIFAFAFYSFVSFILLHFLVSWFVIFVNSRYTGISSILKMPVTSYSLASVGAGFFVIMLSVTVSQAKLYALCLKRTTY